MILIEIYRLRTVVTDLSLTVTMISVVIIHELQWSIDLLMWNTQLFKSVIIFHTHLTILGGGGGFADFGSFSSPSSQPAVSAAVAPPVAAQPQAFPPPPAAAGHLPQYVSNYCHKHLKKEIFKNIRNNSTKFWRGFVLKSEIRL